MRGNDHEALGVDRGFFRAPGGRLWNELLRRCRRSNAEEEREE